MNGARTEARRRPYVRNSTVRSPEVPRPQHDVPPSRRANSPSGCRFAPVSFAANDAIVPSTTKAEGAPEAG